MNIRNCSVIITTHTIEEAENLSDKLGILIGGQFVCYGGPEYLKKYILIIFRKFSDGYYISLLINEEHIEEDILEIITK